VPGLWMASEKRGCRNDGCLRYDEVPGMSAYGTSATSRVMETGQLWIWKRTSTLPEAHTQSRPHFTYKGVVVPRGSTASQEARHGRDRPDYILRSSGAEAGPGRAGAALQDADRIIKSSNEAIECTISCSNPRATALFPSLEIRKTRT
jgi:hypothetical protein